MKRLPAVMYGDKNGNSYNNILNFILLCKLLQRLQIFQCAALNFHDIVQIFYSWPPFMYLPSCGRIKKGTKLFYLCTA